jgi:hypothetical protein
MNENSKVALHNNSSNSQIEARAVLLKLFAERPISDEHLLTNLGLFSRASALAKTFFLFEAYSLIKPIPGDIFVFGVWLGQDMVLLESLRAILEPYNASRTLVGFDTFSGYTDLSAEDKISDVVNASGYGVPEDYEQYLHELLRYHRLENAMGHAVRHKLVCGDVSETVGAYINENQQSLIALAYFDMALYEPTLAALSSIGPRLIPGSVLVFDELNDPRYPGESKAYREWICNRPHQLLRSKFLPDRTYLILK